MDDAAFGSKVVLISGASGGLGAAVALRAARLGHRLALTARRADRLEEAAAGARDLGAAEVLTVPADLADPESAERLVAEIVGHFGGLDVLINNAGIGLPDLFASADPDAIRRQIEVNLAAPILLTRLALPHLIRSRGMVINVGSAITSLATPALGVYGATKAGLAYWNDALRRELRHRGLRVCLVEPGPVATDFFRAAGAMKGPHESSAGRDYSWWTYNSMLDPPPWFVTADADAVGKRIVRLIEHPRRRLSVPGGVVWTWRAIGWLPRIVPWLGDAVISALARHAERVGARAPEEARR